MKYQLIKQHYDMAPGTVLYSVPGLGPNIFTIEKDMSGEPYLRIVPKEKVEKIDE